MALGICIIHTILHWAVWKGYYDISLGYYMRAARSLWFCVHDNIGQNREVEGVPWAMGRSTWEVEMTRT